jgi:RNA polymerase sigma-70 factor (ECF subfamily)
MPTDIHDRVLERHSNYLFKFALRHVRDPELARDLVQDTFIVALTASQPYAGRSAMRTWLVGILKHKIADAHRARVRAPVSFEALAEEGVAAAEAEDSEGSAFELGQATRAVEPERAEALRRFRESCAAHLSRMPAQSARAFLLSAVLGHDTDEVGRMLGVSAANVWTMVHRTRKRLRDALESAVPA